MRGLASQIALLVGVLGQVRARPGPVTNIDPKAGCATNASVIGPCFEVRGRAVVGNGTPAFRIMQTGTSRVFGVLPAESEIVPGCLADAVTPTSEASGEFLVCPFVAAKEGHMQMVCVESVGELSVRRWDNGKRAYVAGDKSPGCALPGRGPERHWRDGMPAEVVALVERFGVCNHWGGEEGYSEERRKEIEAGVKLVKCEQIEGDQRRLRRKYAHRPRVLRVIEGASEYEGD